MVLVTKFGQNRSRHVGVISVTEEEEEEERTRADFCLRKDSNPAASNDLLTSVTVNEL